MGGPSSTAHATGSNPWEWTIYPPIVAYAWATPPPIPPSIAAVAGDNPDLTARLSISAEVKMSTAPLVEASIHAWG